MRAIGGRTLQRVSNCVTNDGSFVLLRAFASVMALFNEFLGVVPSPACVAGGDRHHDSRRERAGQESRKSLCAQQEPDRKWRENDLEGVSVCSCGPRTRGLTRALGAIISFSEAFVEILTQCS